MHLRTHLRWQLRTKQLRTKTWAAVGTLAVSLGLAGTAGATGPAPAPGEIVTSAPTSFHPLPGQPTRTKAWHITYRSTTARGAPDVVSGTVIVPQDGRTGPRPLVTYAVGTVGLADQCAPSAGFPRGTTVEGNLIQLLTLRGWAVAVTDYEGLGTPGTHTYTVGRSEGHAVLDAARAAQRLPGTGLSVDGPVGIMGYSQGGQAAGWAAELHDTYAPELNVKGTAAGGVPADLIKAAEFNDGRIGAGLVLMAAIGQDAAFPELDLASYLNGKGRARTAYFTQHCVAADTAAGLFNRISDVTVRNPLQQPDWQRVLRSSDLGTHVPDRPVHLYHGTQDELVPYDSAALLRAGWCAKGAVVDWKPLPQGGHGSSLLAESVPAANWLADRFAGKPAAGNC
ncbi:lipase family protein [Streptomyces roseoverticillatus]|uniref:lipase family protein n=1 Tax=Streptomyces roseoverticillatus TaxID=66429 RepID=UPI0004C28190|nr:lipase family protein [Streptomyces roseoverticillatus]